MRQSTRRMVLLFCMMVCVFTMMLSGCGSRPQDTLIPESIAAGMKTGARNYLTQFDSYDDTALQDELSRMQRQKNTVMESAILSWQSCRADLGKLAAILSEEVERVSDNTYQVTVLASFEKRELEFVLTAEELEDAGYTGGAALVPTELSFYPKYTMGEKLARAALNSLLGMGTVFIVLLLISILIGRLEKVNRLAEKLKAGKEEKH